jgi:hypothetical protein
LVSGRRPGGANSKPEVKYLQLDPSKNATFQVPDRPPGAIPIFGGTIQVSGAGFNLFCPNAASGSRLFDVGYTGSIFHDHL